MKNFKITSILLALVIISLSACIPQEGSSSGAIGNLPSLNFETFGAKAVTTSLDDALAIEGWIDVSSIRSSEKPDNFNQGGYYRYDTRSYCLHAGKHGASGGNGYLIAPLKGSQASFIASIVNNSHQNRDIAQHDIQRIIWAIEAGTSLKDFSGQQAIALTRLASPEQLAKYELDLQLDTKKLSGIARSLLPQDIQNALNFYDDFNHIVTDANASYEEIENLAVLSGAVPASPNDLIVQEGNWARIGENLFMRSFPKTYSRTTVEILKLAPYNIEKDEFGRIVVFESENFRQEVKYYNSLSFVTAPDGKQYPYWEIEELRLINPEQENDIVIKDAGWIIPSDVVIDDSSLNDINSTGDLLVQSNRFNKYRKRMEQVKKWREKYNGFNEKWETATKDLSEEDFKNVTDVKHYEEGLKAALTGSPADKASWLDKHMSIVVRAWQYAICMLGGSCSNKEEVKPPVSTPGEGERQRLLSDWGYGNDDSW